ncbi:hypothetical protein PC112_g8851 [Phytophthora cactorum]|nr:hypothetical protein PC112_g8851 [Phytophthora cactorum]
MEAPDSKFMLSSDSDFISSSMRAAYRPYVHGVSGSGTSSSWEAGETSFDSAVAESVGPLSMPSNTMLVSKTGGAPTLGRESACSGAAVALASEEDVRLHESH